MRSSIKNEVGTVDLQRVIQSSLQWFFYLLRKWWILALVSLTGAILGVITAYIDKPQYESKLTFALEDGSGGLNGALSLAAEFGFSVGSGSNIFEGENILTLLSSRRIIERVLLSVDTINGKPVTIADYYLAIQKDTTKPSNKPDRLSLVSFPVNLPHEKFTYLQDSVLLNIYKNFAVGGALSVSKPDKKLNLYEVKVLSPNEHFTKIFTKKVVDEAIRFYTEIRTKKSRQTLDILEERVAQTKGQLKSSITGRASIQDANVNSAFQQAQATLQQKQVDITAYSGAYAELYKNLELARYQYLKDIPLLQIIDDAEYPMKRIKKGKLKTGLVFGIIAALLSTMTLTLVYISKSPNMKP